MTIRICTLFISLFAVTSIAESSDIYEALLERYDVFDRVRVLNGGDLIVNTGCLDATQNVERLDKAKRIIGLPPELEKLLTSGQSIDMFASHLSYGVPSSRGMFPRVDLQFHVTPFARAINELTNHSGRPFCVLGCYGTDAVDYWESFAKVSGRDVYIFDRRCSVGLGGKNKNIAKLYGRLAEQGLSERKIGALNVHILTPDQGPPPNLPTPRRRGPQPPRAPGELDDVTGYAMQADVAASSNYVTRHPSVPESVQHPYVLRIRPRLPFARAGSMVGGVAIGFGIDSFLHSPTMRGVSAELAGNPHVQQIQQALSSSADFVIEGLTDQRADDAWYALSHEPVLYTAGKIDSGLEEAKTTIGAAMMLSPADYEHLEGLVAPWNPKAKKWAIFTMDYYTHFFDAMYED
jgi:hypothetical protein